MNKLKYVISLVITYIFLPITTYAWGPTIRRYTSQSVGENFRETFLMFIGSILDYSPYLFLMTFPLILPLGYFIHRRYIAYSFFIIYPALIFLEILRHDNEKLTNALIPRDAIFPSIYYFYISVFITVSAFFISTAFNKIRKKKYKFDNKDYIPLGTIIFIAFVFFTLPISTGKIVCNIPALNQSFNCTYVK